MSIDDITPKEWDRVRATGHPTFEEYMKRLDSKFVYDSTENYGKEVTTDAGDFADCWNEAIREWRATVATKESQEALEKEQEKQGYQPIVPCKLPEDAKERKAIPVYTGFVNYFPRAIAEVAKISLVGGIQHGQTAETLHWDRPKSGDELDAMMRHILDKDWAQVAWRAMANLEKYLEREENN